MNEHPSIQPRPPFVRMSDRVAIRYHNRPTRNAWRVLYRFVRLHLNRDQARGLLIGLMWSEAKITTDPEPRRQHLEVVR